MTLDEFADCDSNLAANRQTRMLADLALVNCYNRSSMPLHERNRLMLASAKRNLAGKKLLRAPRTCRVIIGNFYSQQCRFSD